MIIIWQSANVIKDEYDPVGHDNQGDHENHYDNNDNDGDDDDDD